MNKIITMTLWKRPEYTKRVFDALEKCEGIENYTLIVCIDPGCDEVVSIVGRAAFCAIDLVLNPKRLDCPRNTRQALSRGFEQSDFVVHIEDDTVPAPDALRFFEYCAERYREDQTVFTVCAYNKENPPPEDYYRLFRNKWFIPWMFAVWKDRWDLIKDKFDFGRGGFGINMNKYFRGDRYEIRPRLARCQNIGRRNGRYCPSPKFHTLKQWNKYWAGRYELPEGKFWEAENEREQKTK